MREPVVAREVAEAEVNEWLEFKDIFEPSEDQKQAIETIVKAIMYDRLKYNQEEKTFVQKLKTPMGTITELKYRDRINDNHVQKFMKGVPNNDPDQRVNAYIAAVTDQGRVTIAGMDYSDKRIANAITTFFL